MFGRINHLRKRKSGVYYAVFHVPIILQKIVGKRQAWKSLKTYDKKQAFQTLATLAPKVYSFFEQLKQGENMDRRKVKQVFMRFFENVLKKQRLSLEGRQKEIDLLRSEKVQYEEDFYEYILSGDWKELPLLESKNKEFDEKIKKVKSKDHGIIWSKKKYNKKQANKHLSLIRERIKNGTSLPFAKGVEKILEKNDVGTVNQDDLKEANLLFVGLVKKWFDLAQDPDSILHMNQKVFKEMMLGNHSSSTLNESRFSKITFWELFEKWLNSNILKKKEKEKRKKMISKAEVLFALFGKQKDLARATYLDVEKMVGLLLKLPANKTKLYPGLTIHQAIRKANNDPKKIIKRNTLHTYLLLFKRCVKWGYHKELLPKDLSVGIELPPEREGESIKRVSFEVSELNILFSHLNYLKKDIKQDFWIPLIGLFTGMRRTEICQLLISDIKHEGGVSYIEVSQLKEGKKWIKKLKTKTSERRVPIHPALIELGFLNYVKSQKNTFRLFSRLSKKRFENGSEGFGRRFDTVLKGSGLKRKGLCFHSFRHTFADAMRNNHVDREIADRLGGWKDKQLGQRGSYGAGYDIKVLNEAMQKVKYDGLNLSKLKNHLIKK